MGGHGAIRFGIRHPDVFGVLHETEEYRGGWGDRQWGADRRIYTKNLPVFARKLLFEQG